MGKGITRAQIAQRVALDIAEGSYVNLGIGMPEGIGAVCNEERIYRYITLTADPGARARSPGTAGGAQPLSRR